MPLDDRHIKVPRSPVRQNLIYSIESLARRVSQVEEAQGEHRDVDFFTDTHRDLKMFRTMAERDVKIRQVYIYQKLFDISRDLFKYAPPSDVKFQFLFIQKSLADEYDEMSDEDKKVFDDLQEEVQMLENDGRLSLRSLSAICYFSKTLQDKQALIIWNSEKLFSTSVRLGVLLCIGALASLCTAVGLARLDPSDQLAALKYVSVALKLLGAVFGGVTGGCISAIAGYRGHRDSKDSKDSKNSKDSGDPKDSKDQTVIPLINTDWMRPILGGVAGLVFGLIATVGVGEVRAEFVIGGAIAFGFSEQVLYAWLGRRGEQLGGELGGQVVRSVSKNRKRR
jgi:hypothetical protein